MAWKSFKKISRRRGLSKWGAVWADRPCVSLNKNGLSFNREAAAVGLEFGASVEVLFDEEKPGMVAIRLLESSEASTTSANVAWIIQRNGSGKAPYGTRISNRGIAVTIGNRFFGSCSTLEKQGGLLIGQFVDPTPAKERVPQIENVADKKPQIDLDALQVRYPDDMIVSGRKGAGCALGIILGYVGALPVDTIRTGSAITHRYRVGELRRWHATNPKSPWASRYGSGP